MGLRLAVMHIKSVPVPVNNFFPFSKKPEFRAFLLVGVRTWQVAGFQLCYRHNGRVG